MDVVMGLLVLALLAVGVGALGTHGRGRVALQRHRQAALALAHGRLEEVRAAPFASVRPLASNQVPCYLSRTAGSWRVTAANPGETRVVNGRTFKLSTTVRWVDADGGSASLDALGILVSVPVREAAGDEVVLESWKRPGG